MKEYFSIKKNKRKRIIKKIKRILKKKQGIVFAFIFGSFLDGLSFRDIDIGIYTKGDMPNYEKELSKEIAGACNLPLEVIEIKILNSAPNSFFNSIFKTGLLLFSNDEKMMSDIIENSSLQAISNEYVAQQSLKELIPA